LAAACLGGMEDIDTYREMMMAAAANHNYQDDDEEY